MKVAIYCRVSTEMQNVDRQEKSLREYCRRNSHQITKVYKDIYSGAKDSRPAFNEMLKDMRSFKFEGVIVTKLDRIGRSLQHLLSLFDEFNNKKVKFIATTQNIDTTTSIGLMQMQIMGAFAEFERNLISERTKEALRNNKKVGKRGKDKKPRKRRVQKRPKKNKEEESDTVVIKKYKRFCKRCGNSFKTKHHTAKICPSCWGG